jgi:hypothetical protein
MKSLSKREVKSLSAGIEKFDLEGSIHDYTFLPDELCSDLRLKGSEFSQPVAPSNSGMAPSSPSEG